MKRLCVACAALALTALLAGDVMGQQKKDGDKKDPEKKGGFGQGGFGGGFGGFSPLLRALDTDKDGELSADEIKNASAALKALDKDGDGKLSAEELRPAFGGPGGGGFGRPGGGGGFGDPKAFAERLRGFDKNKDGKLTKDELPEFMQERFFERADTNKDGVIDDKELQKAAETSPGRPGGGGAPGANPGTERRPGRPDGDNNADRTKRPARPDGN